MKLLFYINAINGGGAARALTVLAGGLAKKGHEIVFATSYPCETEYELDERIIRINLEADKSADSFIQRNVRRIARLRKVLKDQKPDALVSFMAEPNLRSLVATIGTGIPAVASVRNDPSKEYGSLPFRLAANILFKRASWLVFQTPEAQTYFGEAVARKSSVIPNPIHDAFFDVERKPCPGLVVSCGRLVEQKNHALLVESFSKVVRQISCARLEIYGEGELEGALRNQISMLGLDDQVSLKGGTNDVPEVLSKASVFVLSSRYEGMPNALMEALAVGVPSISTDCPCGGPRMLIRDGVNGLLVDVDDAEGLASKIIALLSDKTLSLRLTSGAKAYSHSYRSTAVVNQWEQLLIKLVR